MLNAAEELENCARKFLHSVCTSKLRQSKDNFLSLQRRENKKEHFHCPLLLQALFDTNKPWPSVYLCLLRHKESRSLSFHFNKVSTIH